MSSKQLSETYFTGQGDLTNFQMAALPVMGIPEQEVKQELPTNRTLLALPVLCLSISVTYAGIASSCGQAVNTSL